MNFLIIDEPVLALSRQLELALDGVSERLRSWASDASALHYLLLELLNSAEARRLAELQLAVLQGQLKLSVGLDGAVSSGAGANVTLMTNAEGGRYVLFPAAWAERASAQEIEAALVPALAQLIHQQLSDQGGTIPERQDLITAWLESITTTQQPTAVLAAANEAVVEASALATLEQAWLAAQQCLQIWASDSARYNQLLLEVFRVSPSEQSQVLQEQLLNGELQIPLEVIPASSMGCAAAAYVSPSDSNSERIVINASWLVAASQEQLQAVLLEEIGHGLDARLNPLADTTGDEGEVFSALIRGVTPRAAAATENDHLLIAYNGTDLTAEAAASQIDTQQPQGTLTLSNPQFRSENTYHNQTLISVAAVDIDNDDDLDLFGCSVADGALWFYRNTSSTISLPAYEATGIRNAFGISGYGQRAKPAFTDIDGDGDFDLFVGDSNGNISCYENLADYRGGPTFQLLGVNLFGIENVGSLASPTFSSTGDLVIGTGDQGVFF